MPWFDSYVKNYLRAKRCATHPKLTWSHTGQRMAKWKGCKFRLNVATGTLHNWWSLTHRNIVSASGIATTGCGCATAKRSLTRNFWPSHWNTARHACTRGPSPSTWRGSDIFDIITRRHFFWLNVPPLNCSALFKKKIHAPNQFMENSKIILGIPYSIYPYSGWSELGHSPANFMGFINTIVWETGNHADLAAESRSACFCCTSTWSMFNQRNSISSYSC